MIPALINLIIYLLVVGILIWLVLYIVDAIPIPDPFNRIIKLVVVVLACLIIILLLLQVLGLGGGGINLPKVAQAIEQERVHQHVMEMLNLTGG